MIKMRANVDSKK